MIVLVLSAQWLDCCQSCLEAGGNAVLISISVTRLQEGLEILATKETKEA